MARIICKDVVDNVIGYIDAELDNKTIEELEKHQSDCPECKAFIKTYRRMQKLTGRFRKKSFVTPEIRERLKKCLKSD